MMGYHRPGEIKKLEDLVNERLTALIATMSGRDLSEQEKKMKGDDYRFLSPTDIRIAIDDFNTVLKEIKSRFGKG